MDTPLDLMEAAELEHELAKKMDELSKLGPEYAKAHGVAEALNDQKGDVLADITHRAEGSSHAEKKRNARISDEWKEYRKKLQEAKDKAFEMKLRYDVKRRWLDAISQIMNNKRAEMRLSQ